MTDRPTGNARAMHNGISSNTTPQPDGPTLQQLSVRHPVCRTSDERRRSAAHAFAWRRTYFAGGLFLLSPFDFEF